MARILLVVDRLLRPHRTGIDRYYDELIYRLPRLAPDFDFTLISLGEPNQQHPSFAPNLKHHGLPISRRQFLAASLLRLPTPLKAYCDRADLVHLMSPLLLAPRSPLITTIYDLTPQFLPRLYPWHARFLFRHAIYRLAAARSWFSVISEQTGKDLHTLFGIPETRVCVIPLGVGTEFHPENNATRVQNVRLRYSLPEKYFLYIGSMHPRKNLSTLLKAYQLFHETDCTGTQLVIAGRMDLGGDQLIEQIRGYGLEKLISLPGYLDEVDLPTVISKAAAMIYPSLYEGFGLPVLEAMACGTVVIASRAGSIPEVAEEHALLVDPLDVDGFVYAMQKVVSDPVWCSKMVEAGLEWAGRFSWHSTAVSTLELYVKLLSDSRAL